MTPKHKHLFKEKLKTNKRGYLVVSVEDVHKEYKKHEEKTLPAVDYKTFRAILEFIFLRVWYYMITELWIFRPPNNFGEFYISEKYDSDGFHVDWKQTRKKGKLVKVYNLHTDGKEFYIKWNKRFTKIVNKFGYKFKAYRGSKEEIAGRRGVGGHIVKCSEVEDMKDFRAHII